MLTSAGASADMRITPGESKLSWNSGMECKTSVVPGKMWVAEIRIPRSSMPEIQGNSFAANFTRGRLLNGVECKVPYYTWSEFPKQTPENCGIVKIGEKPADASVIRDGDFDGLHVEDRRFLAGAGQPRSWFTGKKISLDHNIFRTGGASIRFTGEDVSIRQYLPKTALKSGTAYRLSFFLRLENVVPSKNFPDGGFDVGIRFGNRGGNIAWYPVRRRITGSLPWTRFEFTLTTPDNVGDKSRPYFEFVLLHCSGTAWADHVKLIEIVK